MSTRVRVRGVMLDLQGRLDAHATIQDASGVRHHVAALPRRIGSTYFLNAACGARSTAFAVTLGRQPVTCMDCLGIDARPTRALVGAS